MFKNWGSRDWFWLSSIFLGIILIILTWRLNDNDSVVNIISMFSSGASIILALAAIVQSTMYNNSANELNARVTEKISVMENNVELIKDNLFRNVKKVIESSSIDPEEKEEIQYKLYNAMQEKNFFTNSMIHSIAYERLLVKRLNNIISNDYIIKVEFQEFKHKVDMILENEFKKVFIEVKVLSRMNKSVVKNASSKLKMIIENQSNLENKELFGLIVVISDNKFDYLEKIDDRISVVEFTKTEIIEASDYLIREKLMI